jgi:hypothetical protein
MCIKGGAYQKYVYSLSSKESSFVGTFKYWDFFDYDEES